MAGSKSNYLENLLLTFTLANPTAATRPTTWYIGLFTDTAGTSIDQPGTESVNVGGGCPGYARTAVTSWAISGTNPTQALNNQAVTFTATGPWLAVNYFGVFDALTAGNLLYWGSIPTKTLANTDQLQFGISQITITED